MMIIQFGFDVVKLDKHIPIVDCRVIPNPWRIGSLQEMSLFCD